MYIKFHNNGITDKITAIFTHWAQTQGWDPTARPLANASENLVGRVENRPAQVEFCIGYIRDCLVRVSAKKFWFPSLNTIKNFMVADA